MLIYKVIIMSILVGTVLSVLLSISAVSQTDSLKSKPLPASLKKIIQQVILQPTNSNDVEIEIDGLLVDDTKTKSGKDFYDLFYADWDAPIGSKSFTITVSEKPFRLTSTMIQVSINDNVVYQGILQPREDILEALTEEAIATTQNYLSNYDEITRQLNGEDLAGSGIY
jgi:curli production assembly/transport component CsgE